MSPKTPEQFQEIREEKRTLIMDIALKYFASEGYHKTTISQIAKHAGISKGLMYNYFKSKEHLLSDIIDRTMEDIGRYFDPNNDGFLTEHEFELFIRKLFNVLREKIDFWRLFYQLLMQNEVRQQLLKSTQGTVKNPQDVYSNSSKFMQVVIKILVDYFFRKKNRKSEDYDPVLEMNMFIYTIEGFAMMTVYMDEVDEIYYEKTINRIIELYK
jgi:AcrR family transcriptional regulator